MLLVVAAVAYYYAGGYAAKVSAMKTEAVSLVSHSSKDTFRKNQTSIAYDVNGTTLSVLKGEKDVYYIEYEDIPVYIKQAIISTEDKRFYKHKGIDYRGIMRAIIAMIQDGEVTQGGSTITQQLARTVFLSNEKTWERNIPKRIFWSSTSIMCILPMVTMGSRRRRRAILAQMSAICPFHR